MPHLPTDTSNSVTTRTRKTSDRTDLSVSLYQSLARGDKVDKGIGINLFSHFWVPNDVLEPP